MMIKTLIGLLLLASCGKSEDKPTRPVPKNVEIRDVSYSFENNSVIVDPVASDDIFAFDWHRAVVMVEGDKAPDTCKRDKEGEFKSANYEKIAFDVKPNKTYSIRSCALNLDTNQFSIGITATFKAPDPESKDIEALSIDDNVYGDTMVISVVLSDESYNDNWVPFVAISTKAMPKTCQDGETKKVVTMGALDFKGKYATKYYIRACAYNTVSKVYTKGITDTKTTAADPLAE